MKAASLFTISLLFIACSKSVVKPYEVYHEPYRGQLHYSPRANWMNDPNGMVYYNGIYHLFYQYNPDAIVWGPMHWGHATSKDMIHWQEQPIALYPDNLGYIYSGSIVIDSQNTSGFGRDGITPMVAVFTHHNIGLQSAGLSTFENQSIAYSLDEGQTWTKYASNPVLINPGIKDFRDPKVMWYPPTSKWIMTLAASDKIIFYSSPDLKTWKKESDFGETLGSHSGVWECPDLFPLTLNNKTYWVLLASVNPGGPNGGSATQYFIGDFDGETFTPIDNKTRWIDYGPDNYAGVTWSNTSNRRVFLAWMSNWNYSGLVPAETWRNSMTLPRELALNETNGNILLSSMPIKELASLENTVNYLNVKNNSSYQVDNISKEFKLELDIDKLKDFDLTLSNTAGDKLVIGYDEIKKSYYIDRSSSGAVGFQPSFPKKLYVPRFDQGTTAKITLIIDASSAELFADNNLSVMSCTYFTKLQYSKLSIKSNVGCSFQKVTITQLNSIW